MVEGSGSVGLRTGIFRGGFALRVVWRDFASVKHPQLPFSFVGPGVSTYEFVLLAYKFLVANVVNIWG